MNHPSYLDWGSSVTNFYNTQKTYDKRYGYYIHHHAYNIGKLEGININTVSSLFKAYKQQKVNKAVKYQYASLVKDTTFIDNQSIKFIDENLNVNESVISKLDSFLKENLQKYYINANQISKALQQVKSNKLSSSTELINSSRENLQQFGAELDKAFSIICQTLDLYKANGKEILEGIMLQENSDNPLSLLPYAEKVEVAIKKLNNANKNKMVSIDRAKIDHVTKTLKILKDNLIAGTMKSKYKDDDDIYKNKPITFNAIKNLFEKEIFSVGLGEAIAFKTEQIAAEAPLKMLKDDNGKTKGLKLVGQNSVPLWISNPKGEYASDSILEASRQGKVDIKLKNVFISLKDVFGSDYSGKMRLDIGFSNKLYQSVNFNNENISKYNNSFSVGGGLTLEQAINMTFDNLKLKYLAYNTFAWENASETQLALINLQDTLFTRSIVNLFSSRGGKDDFAGYIIINGKLLSIWEIILYAINSNIGLSRSQSTGQEGIVFSLGSERTKLADVKKLPWPAGAKLQDVINNRSSFVRDIIRSIPITAYVRPVQLMKIIK